MAASMRPPDSAVRCGWAELRTHLAAMPASTGSSRAERLLDHLDTEVAGIDVTALVAVSGGRRDALVDYLAHVS
jgi:hypothetical protein